MYLGPAGQAASWTGATPIPRFCAGTPLRGSGNLNSAGLSVCSQGDLCLFPGGVLSVL